MLPQTKLQKTQILYRRVKENSCFLYISLRSQKFLIVSLRMKVENPTIFKNFVQNDHIIGEVVRHHIGKFLDDLTNNSQSDPQLRLPIDNFSICLSLWKNERKNWLFWLFRTFFGVASLLSWPLKIQFTSIHYIINRQTGIYQIDKLHCIDGLFRKILCKQMLKTKLLSNVFNFF